MSVELFRTVVPVLPGPAKINYTSVSMLFGSCFTENIGDKLSYYKFPTVTNPFGITYNPFSLKAGLMRLLSGLAYNHDEINCKQGLYFSFDHHSKFSSTDGSECLFRINSSFNQACQNLKSASYLFLTFGTSYYYVLKSNGKIVSNCHKLPEQEFERKRLGVEEIVNDYREIIPALLANNPDLKIVFTVSPIRHWKDGAYENQVSKSILFVAIDRLCSIFDCASYFPAYELLMDELRDYRFYEEDMLHPNKQAIDFIWKRFKDSFIGPETQKVMNEVEKVKLAYEHRPFNKESEQFRNFVTQQIRKTDQLMEAYPQIDFREELELFKSYLK